MLRTTIALTRHSEPNELVFGTLQALARQKDIEARILFLDQQPDAETAALCRSLGSDRIRFAYRRQKACGLSHARNVAIEDCDTPTLLFIDADAIAEPDWARELTRTLLQEKAGVAGGRIVLQWHRPPLLITRARIVAEQYSMLDHGAGMMEVPGIVGAGFGMNLAHLGSAARFDERLGRQGGGLLGGEESDLCRRVLAAGFSILYQGRALVYHQVPGERVRYRWIFRRLFYSGVTRALRGGGPSPKHRLAVWDVVFMPVVLVPYMLGYLKGRSLRR